MKKSDHINELALALAKTQGEIKGAIKDSQNPFFKSTYADLSAVWDSIRGPMSKNGLSVVQTTDIGDTGNLVLVTTLLHSSGQWISGVLPILPIKNDPQSVGSAITYARRFALSAIVGDAPHDDDAEKAMSRPMTHPSTLNSVPYQSQTPVKVAQSPIKAAPPMKNSLKKPDFAPSVNSKANSKPPVEEFNFDDTPDGDFRHD